MLDFELSRGQVKSCHFPEKKDARRQYFYFLDNFFEIICRERLGKLVWIIIWIHYYLSNGTILDFDLEKSCWVGKMPNFATNNINIWLFIWFFRHQT